MPVLPIIDLLIVLGWTALMAGGVLKAVYITTTYRPTIFSLTPNDFLVVAAVFLVFALTLAARTWVKLNEPRLLARHGVRGSHASASGWPRGQPEVESADAEQPHHLRGR